MTDHPLAEIDRLHDSCGVYTNPSIVCRILDAIEWTADADLSQSRLLEPAAGNGEFVIEAARRLVQSLRKLNIPVTSGTLAPRINGFELHSGACAEARQRTKAALDDLGVHPSTSAACARHWYANSDFLLTDRNTRPYTHTAGNPPYIRWPKIPPSLKETYNDQLPRDMTGGDLFLPFLDLAFEQLQPHGRAGFLCSDRWRYMAFAGAFRRKWIPQLTISSEQSVPAAEAFQANVDSYPSILVATKRLSPCASPSSPPDKSHTTLRDLNYTVRVGPALGHSPAFVLEPGEDDVEPELLRPWIDASEVTEGSITSRGRRVVTIWNADGKLLDLRRFPMLSERLRRFSAVLKRRFVVRNGGVWYRTIDRVRAQDWIRPKLLVPEIAKIPRVAIDRSGAIPSHGVYAIFAPDDDVDALYSRLRDGGLAHALQGVSPRIKGGYIRCYKRFLLNAPILSPSN